MSTTSMYDVKFDSIITSCVTITHHHQRIALSTTMQNKWLSCQYMVGLTQKEVIFFKIKYLQDQ